MRLDEMQDRILNLEKQNMRFRRIAIGLLMAIASAVLVGQTLASQRKVSPAKSAPKSASISMRLSRLESRVDALSKVASVLLVAQDKSENGSAASSDVDDLSSQVSDLDDKLKNVSDDVDSLKSDASDVSDLKSDFDDVFAARTRARTTHRQGPLPSRRPQGLMGTYLSRVENGHTVPSLETNRHVKCAGDFLDYLLVYDAGEKARKPEENADELAWNDSP